MKKLFLITTLLLTACSTPTRPVTNFEECVAAGNPIMESYPRQCQHEGVNFVEIIEITPESQTDPAEIEAPDLKTLKRIQQQEGIPENCVSWFDGCNNCSVTNGVVGACTLRYCEASEIKGQRCLKTE